MVRQAHHERIIRDGPVPQAVQFCHELLLWLILQLNRFSRSRRFTVGERVEAGLLEVLELLVETAGKFLGGFLRCEHFL
ncbi:MAG: hypothetical protein IPM58_00535 [Nitrospira sp.]|nr:hypothetical protein [Nitrospira sp.]